MTIIRLQRIILILGVLTSFAWRSNGQINGNWSDWAVFDTPCSATCGGGVKVIMRSCTNPAPQNNGANCTKMDNTTGLVEYTNTSCNNQSCFDGIFTDWILCENCTIGTSVRYALCDVNVTCTGDKYKKETKPCNRWNMTVCPLPCSKNVCPSYGNCADKSTPAGPAFSCSCIMGYQMSADGKACVRPPPDPPTVEPIPTMPPAQKVVATVISTTASSVLIIFVTITLIIFLIFRVFSPDRVIQMNMEIALVSAHSFLMFPPNTYENPPLCKIVSICIHFFFTAAFAFMMLEALHMYSLVAHVVRKDGLFTRLQNMLIGWGFAVIIVAVNISFELMHYGGEYHCFTRMDTPLFYGQLIPIVTLVVVACTMIEAAGVEGYKKLKDMDREQLFSAKISHYTNLIIVFLVLAHWFIGMLSQFQQNLALYSIFSILNGVTGFCILVFHCSCNHEVRAKLKATYKYMCLGESA